MLGQLGDTALDGFQILNHIGICVAFGFISLRDFAVLGAGLMPTFEAFGRKFLLVAAERVSYSAFV